MPCQGTAGRETSAVRHPVARLWEIICAGFSSSHDMQPSSSTGTATPDTSTLVGHADLADADPQILECIRAEEERQQNYVGLIASENLASRAVMQAQGSVLTNKYAEGYPAKRYYGGCEQVDRSEALAIERAKDLFGACYANVQPHSGAQANAAVLLTLAKANDTILGMDLSHGGHLTHGSPANFSGKLYRAVHYHLNEATGDIDYDDVERLAHAEKPKVLIAGFSAFSGVPDWARFRSIADSVGALLLVDMAHIAGLVAVGLQPNPVPHAHVVTSTTHKTLRGPRGGLILSGQDDPDLHKKLNSGVFPGTQGGPLEHVIAAKAVCFTEAAQPGFKAYQQAVVDNAQAMCRVMAERGYDIVSGGTTNHLFLVSLVGRELTGKDAEAALGQAHITLNKNAVPRDPRSPFVTSGLRIGTALVTSRGFNVPAVEQVAQGICDVLEAPQDEAVIGRVREQMLALCQTHPIPS